MLEDLEALVKLLSARARDAEEVAAQLQQDVTAAHAAADRASNDQLASSKQADSSKKEVAHAKRVCLALVLWHFQNQNLGFPVFRPAQIMLFSHMMHLCGTGDDRTQGRAGQC